MSNKFEQHQVEALAKAYDILKEHFESSVIIVQTTIETNGKMQEVNAVYWAGGFTNAFGLINIVNRWFGEVAVQNCASGKNCDPRDE